MLTADLAPQLHGPVIPRTRADRPNPFARLLHQRRGQLGWPLDIAADFCALGRSSYRAYEWGRAKPELVATLLLIRDGMQIPLPSLIEAWEATTIPRSKRKPRQ